MDIWLIEPHDPLIFRDGRPFGPTPGARAKSLAFPFPSTIAGGVRGLAGLDPSGVFQYAQDKDKLKALKQLGIVGPFLVEIDDDDRVTWLVPTPHDALFLKNVASNGITYIRQLVPLQMPEGAFTDFPGQKYSEHPLALIGLPHAEKTGKPASAPNYWYWEYFTRWLREPSTIVQHKGGVVTEDEVGHNGPTYERRVHITMDSLNHTAVDKALFDTSGIEFTQHKQGQTLTQARRLALAVLVAKNSEFPLKQRLYTLGGERRLVNWQPLKEGQETPLECDQQILKDIVKTKHCRLILLTPAYFRNGYFPTWLLEPREGIQVQVTLKAIACKPPEVVSGWDIVACGSKPTRRLMPAGSVLFLHLDGNDNDIRQWVRQIWLHSISDKDIDRPEEQEQYRHDGFGIAVIGTWSGKFAPMEVTEQ